MALQFDPSPYLAAFQYGQNNKVQNQQAGQQALETLGQGVSQYQQLQRQKQMDDLHKQLMQGQIDTQKVEHSPLVPTGSQSPGNAPGSLSLPGNAPGAPSMPSFQGLNSQSSGVSAPYSTPDFSSLMPNTYPSNQQQTNATPAPSGLFHMQPDGSMGGGSPGSGPSPIVAAHKQFLSSKFGGGAQTAQAPSQPQPMFSSGATNPQPSDPEAPYLKILRDPSESPIRQKMAFEALQRITEEEKTPYEKKGWQLGIDKTKAETGKATSEAAKADAEARKADAEAAFMGQTGGKVGEQKLKLQKQFNEDNKDSLSELKSAQTADGLIDSAKTNPVAYNALPLKLAKMLTGSSRININEIKAMGGSQAILDRAAQAGQQMSEGTITNDNYQFMKGLTKVLIDGNKNELRNAGMRSAMQYSRVNGKDPGSNYTDITGEQYGKETFGALDTSPMSQGGSQPAKQFNSLQEAQAANLPPGTRIQIGTRMATVH